MIALNIYLAGFILAFLFTILFLLINEKDKLLRFSASLGLAVIWPILFAVIIVETVSYFKLRAKFGGEQ